MSREIINRKDFAPQLTRCVVCRKPLTFNIVDGKFYNNHKCDEDRIEKRRIARERQRDPDFDMVFI